MSVAENKRSVVVGIFVLLGVVLFVAGVLTLGGQQKRFVKSVRIKSIFADAEGLKTGNNVRFSGVKIGTVKDIKFSGDSQVEITMNIDEEARKYIHKDAKVKIGSESLIGNKNIVIYGGNPQTPMVEDNDMLLAEKTISSDDIMATLQQNNKNLVTITSNFKDISSKMVSGKGTVGALISDTTLAQNFRSIVSSLEKASTTTAKASASLSQFTAKLNRKDGLANQLLTDTSAFRDLKSSLAQLDQTTASAKEITDNLKKASSKLNDTTNALGVILNDPEFSAHLKTTMGNLESSSQKLDENLEALQHSFLLKEFFKIKARKGRQKVVPEKK